MIAETLWRQELFRETAGLILLFLFVVSLVLYIFRNRGIKYMAAWASLKSWLFAAPLLLLAFSIPSPWPLALLVVVAIYGAKTYFRMVGMYHRNWFVLVTYFYILVLGYLIYSGNQNYFDLVPILFLGTINLIPLLRNSYSHMIQYIALSLLGFIYLGWSFIHLGRILTLDKGIYIVLYLYLLIEFSETASLAGTRLLGRVKLFSRITPNVTLEGALVSVVLTLLLAWGMRHLLPHRSEPYWIVAGVMATLLGRMGDVTLSVVRRDLGIKDTGVFIIGRGDILSRLDKFIFLAPAFYYGYRLLVHKGF